MTTQIRTKRIYDPPEAADGYRVLSDRLWPRGMAKAVAAVDLWAKDVTPSDQLRRAYHGGELTWDEFAGRYETELADNPAWPGFVAEVSGASVVTLLTAAKDVAHSHIPVLARRLADADQRRARATS